MSIRELVRAPAVRVALTAVFVAVALDAWTLVRAFHTPDDPDPPAATLASLQGVSSPAKVPALNIATIVENDLFAEDRSAPSARYRMPDDPDLSKPVVEPPKPVVLGTAVATDGRSFATVQLGDSRPTLVRVGGKIGEWTVTSIGRGKIALVSSGGSRADVIVTKPGT